MRGHAERLEKTLRASPDHGDYVRLHEDVHDNWRRYRKGADLRFGDYGLLYQSYAPAFLAGNRDTEVRAKTYELDDLAAGARVLDLGCNTGFIAMRAAESARDVIGVDHASPLIGIAEAVQAFAAVTQCRFEVGDARTFADPDSFDLIIAAAIHGWMDMPLPDLGRHLATLTTPGGAVLFESQGVRSTTEIETAFEEKVSALCEAGFAVERDGRVCDDGVNLRAFVVLRRSI